MAAYYNEHEPYAAAWLRELISAGFIPAGDVDDRSIRDVHAVDLIGYRQHHFFAGLGGWPRALRLAGWPDDREVWTGSCPCQPFSGAGKREGFDDDRHLWPAWFSLIAVCRPPVVFGEQVARAIKVGWLDAAFDDLEGKDYACAAAVLPACAVGAPHQRDRIWFVANANGAELRQQPGRRDGADGAGAAFAGGDGPAQSLADTDGEAGRPEAGHAVTDDSGQALRERPAQPGRRGGDVADASAPGLSLPEREAIRGAGRRKEGRTIAECGWWSAEPDVGRVAHGIPARVGKLRALGNAIDPRPAAAFIAATM